MTQFCQEMLTQWSRCALPSDYGFIDWCGIRLEIALSVKWLLYILRTNNIERVDFHKFLYIFPPENAGKGWIELVDVWLPLPIVSSCASLSMWSSIVGCCHVTIMQVITATLLPYYCVWVYYVLYFTVERSVDGLGRHSMFRPPNVSLCQIWCDTAFMLCFSGQLKDVVLCSKEAWMVKMLLFLSPCVEIHCAVHSGIVIHLHPYPICIFVFNKISTVVSLVCFVTTSKPFVLYTRDIFAKGYNHKLP